MKILVTADLHYEVARSQRPTRLLAERVCAEDGEVLVLVGDTAGCQLELLRQALALFAGFDGRKLLVAGNHCLWCRDGESSLDRYERMLPDVAAECGFEMLDRKAVAMNGVGLVGSVGWYDYSFADDSLEIPEAFYEAKVAPGAAVQLGGHDELLEAHGHQLTERNLAIRARWMDGLHVRLPMSDKEFCQMLADRLAGRLEEFSAKVDRIVAFVHHLPFGELVPANRPDHFAFAAAYLGARRLGEVLLGCPKVTHVYCGHSHWPGRRKIGHLMAINIGSTYTEKRLEILEI